MTEKEFQEYLERRLTVEEHAARISDAVSELLPEGMGFTLLLTETGEGHAARISDAVSELLPEGMGFTLLLTETGGGRTHFTVQSTLQRESTIRMMKVLLEKWGANQ